MDNLESTWVFLINEHLGTIGTLILRCFRVDALLDLLECGQEYVYYIGIGYMESSPIILM